MFEVFRPHHRLNSVVQITPERLSLWGIRFLLLDVDSTLKQYGSPALSTEVTQWMEEMKRREIGLCLVSNGGAKRIGPFAESLQVPFVAPAYKPLACGCRKAMTMMRFDPGATAMVGDQIFADVLAAKWAGITSILIKPIAPEKEPFWTRLKRPLETLFLKGLGIPHQEHTDCSGTHSQ